MVLINNSIFFYFVSRWRGRVNGQGGGIDAKMDQYIEYTME
jgi:hypothetical protein